MTHRQTRQFCPLDDECQNLLKGAMTEMGFRRAHDKVLRVARTIADLDRSDAIRPSHLNEAINYRMLTGTYGRDEWIVCSEERVTESKTPTLNFPLVAFRVFVAVFRCLHESPCKVR